MRKSPRNINRKMISTMFIISMLNILWGVCRAIPLMSLQNTFGQNILQPVITSECSTNGRCWKLLPAQEIEEHDAIVPEDLIITRLHTRRQIPDADLNTIVEPWGDNVPTIEKRIRPSLSTTRQIGNRITKKDVSRTRGAFGMPFSVLYMSPHGPRGNHASSTQQQGVGKVTENATSTLGQPNDRIALRNRASVQPRRQYSIIPQLFVSYKWGQYGK